MVCHMHQPNMFVNTLLRLHDVGLRVRRAVRCGRRSRSTRPPRRRARSSTAIPEDAAIRGKWGDPDFLQERVVAQPAAQGHAVRRLPRPRLELPRRLQARPQGQRCSTRTARRSPTTIRRSSRRPCTCRRSTSTSACTASTATSRRTRTATATSTARSPRRSRSTAPTATAPRRAIPTLLHHRPGGAAGRHRPVAAAHAGRPQALRVARRQALPALGARSRQGMGGDAGQGHGRSRPSRTTTRRRRARSSCRAGDVDAMGPGRRSGASSRTATTR